MFSYARWYRLRRAIGLSDDDFTRVFCCNKGCKKSRRLNKKRQRFKSLIKKVSYK